MAYLKPVDTHGLRYTPTMRKVAQLIAAFREVVRCAVQLLVVILVGSTPLYLVKALDSSDAYATHSETYAWHWTLAKMRGVVPAGLLLMLWAGAISACFYRIIVHPILSRRRSSDSSGDSSGDCSVTSSEAAHHQTEATAEVVGYKYYVVGAFIINACITVVANVLYIYSVQQDLSPFIHFCIQLSLSVFRLLYVAVALPVLSRPIRSAVHNIRLRFMLLAINNLLLPCVVTALTSDACFQVNLMHCISCT